MDAEELARSVDRALVKAHEAIRKELTKEPYGVVEPYAGQPGVWETAEAVGILRWEEADKELLTAAVEVLISAQNEDGGFAPWPDVASHNSYCESTSRVLLSLAPVCAFAPEYEELHTAVKRAAQWVMENECEEGGWGAYRGLTPRLFPTCFAIQALAAARRAEVGVPRKPSGKAIRRAADWINESQNEDGGHGTRAGETSNHASSCHAAWGLSAASAEVSGDLRKYILEGLGRDLPLVVIDRIDDPERNVSGQFDLSILSSPMGLIGGVSARVGIYEPGITRLVRDLLAAMEDDIWLAPSGRFVWPTYMHVAALRLWLAVHRSFAWAPTTDFSHLRSGPIEPSEPARRSLRDHFAQMPKGWRTKFEKLTPRERQVLGAYTRGHSYKRIAEDLKIRPRTAESYKRAAFKTLGIASDDKELARAIAALGGLIPDYGEVLADHDPPEDQAA